MGPSTTREDVQDTAFRTGFDRIVGSQVLGYENTSGQRQLGKCLHQSLDLLERVQRGVAIFGEAFRSCYRLHLCLSVTFPFLFCIWRYSVLQQPVIYFDDPVGACSSLWWRFFT